MALASHRLWRKYFGHRWSMPAPLGWLLGRLGIEIEAHQLSGAWLAPGKASVAGAFVGALVMLVILFFAPLDDNPFIYFQF